MEKWSLEKAQAWSLNHPWLVGFNYVPSTAVNATQMWQKDTFDPLTIKKELQLAHETGFNTCRVFLQYILWEDDREHFLHHFETFLDLAASCNLSVMPIFFDDCAFDHRDPYLGKQDDPIPGVHNSRWTPSPGFANADNPALLSKLKDYVQDIVSLYKDDARIIIWDLYNEPGNSERGTLCWPLLEHAFEWARSCEPSQPLTAGVWCFQDFDMKCVELSDVISFHSYLSYEGTQNHIQILSQYQRPLFCTEWLHRGCDNTVETHLPLFKAHHIGCYNWGLVQGKTQTHLSWDTMKGTPDLNPVHWQHDLFRSDHTPYNEADILMIKKLT